ncbi:hypothetical protein H6F75_13855 [Nodosilinea sp. FACHB-131]|nr:hypothetical protein [Nodosilinea sp. FACHB-131]
MVGSAHPTLPPSDVMFQATCHVVATTATATTVIGFVPLMANLIGFWSLPAIAGNDQNPASPHTEFP